MTTHRTIPNSEIAVGAPVTNTLVTALRDNLYSVQEGDPSAPDIQGGALAAGTVPTSAMVSYPWSQSDLNTNSVGRSQIIEGAGSASGAGAVTVNLDDYALFPSIESDTTGDTIEAVVVTTPGNNPSAPKFKMNSGGSNYYIAWRYIAA